MLMLRIFFFSIRRYSYNRHRTFVKAWGAAVFFRTEKFGQRTVIFGQNGITSCYYVVKWNNCHRNASNFRAKVWVTRIWVSAAMFVVQKQLELYRPDNMTNLGSVHTRILQTS